MKIIIFFDFSKKILKKNYFLLYLIKRKRLSLAKINKIKILKMKKNLLLFWNIFLLSFFSYSQPLPPDSLWSKSLGGVETDKCNCVHQTSDGGYILAGYTKSFGNGQEDFWLVKTDADGDSLWSRSFGGVSMDICEAVEHTLDGGYILAGVTNQYYGWLVKTDSLGNLEWNHNYGSGWFYDVVLNEDGGFTVAGASLGSTNDFWLIKTDQEGNVEWENLYGTSSTEMCYSLDETFDGGYILSGVKGGSIMLLIKTDENGDSLWSKEYQRENSDWGESVIQFSDGGYVVAGRSYYSFIPGNSDIWLIKTDENGDSLWSRLYGGDYYEYCGEVFETQDNCIVVAGVYYSYWTTGEFWIQKTDSNGDSLWSLELGDINYEECNSAFQIADGSYVLGGYTSTYNNGYDFMLIKTTSDPASSIVEIDPSVPSKFALYHPHPNPFNPATTIRFDLPEAGNVKLVVYDILGREAAVIADGFYPAGYHSVVFDGSDLANGIYFARLHAGGFVGVQKLLLIK